MKSKAPKRHSTSFIAAASIVVMTGCAKTVGHDSQATLSVREGPIGHSAVTGATEGTIGHPPVTVVGLAGVSDSERDMAANIARRQMVADETWGNRAVYVVVRVGDGWRVKVWRIVGQDSEGNAEFKRKQYREFWINRSGEITLGDCPTCPSFGDAP